MNLAYFSPLRPQRSGISDYSEELLQVLTKSVDVTLFVDGFQPINQELTACCEVYDYRRQRSLLKDLDRFDAVIYHMGNDHRYHSGILEASRIRPGIVVLHDFALQDFYLGLARDRSDANLYLDEVEFCHGTKVRNQAEFEMKRGAIPSILSRPLDFPLNARIVKEAQGVILHSKWARDRLLQLSPATPLVHIPLVAGVDKKHERAPEENEVRIASFGLITPGKGIEPALRALSKLRSTNRFRYALVGEPNSYYDIHQVIRRYGMQDLVEITGYVTLDEFERRMLETDIALNIRERTVGETSASLCRLMASGVCSLVSDVAWYGELPGDCVVQIPLSNYTEDLLTAYLERLIEDSSLRKRIGENARQYAQTHHTPSSCAAKYLDFVRDVTNNRTRHEIVATISNDLAQLGAKESDDAFLQTVAVEVSQLMPPSKGDDRFEWSTNNGRAGSLASANGNHDSQHQKILQARTQKVEGIDYKQAARKYLGNIPEERRHHLRTKPFYNLANKPTKYRNEGMDEDTHRHFCDFANIAVNLALPAGSKILDVGCGSGWLSEYFARLGYEVKGIDISPDLIDMSRERVAGVPYGVDHETPLRCSFSVHDIEISPLAEKFDAIVCYDSLHHFEDENAVLKNLAQMLDVGGVLFILEGERPPSGSKSEEELLEVMNVYGTLESPFDYGHLRRLLDENGFAVTGDYASVNGLFEREAIVDDVLPLKNVPINYNYLACKKVIENSHASSVPDSRFPGLLRAEFKLLGPPVVHVAPDGEFEFIVEVENKGDTLWIAGRETRPGTVMPAIKVFDQSGAIVSEVHGEPPLSHAVAPGETMRVRITRSAPSEVGLYTLKLDLVNQHFCWFEEVGSEPLIVQLEVREL